MITLYRIIILFCSVFSLYSYAEEPFSTGYFNSIAIGGHDVMSYRQIEPSAQPKEGDETFSVEWKGAKWVFIDEEDSQLFSANPEKYAPAYNGHCANALSLGEGLIRTSGGNWLILDDQLYLFYAPRGTERWTKGDYKVYKAQADRAWQTIISKQ